MQLKKLYITLLFILIWSFSFSQQYTNYSTKNGLPSNHVYRIIQDYKGFIWFITDKGIVKYDGSEFKIFTTKEGLPTNDIWDVRIGHDNKIWFFTKASAIGYIEKDIVYTFKSVQKNKVLYPRIISQNKDIVFFTDTEKSFYLENNQWVSQKLYNSESILHQQVKELLMKKELDSLKIQSHDGSTLKTIALNTALTENKYRGQLNDSLFCWIGKKSLQLLNLNSLEYKIINYPFGTKTMIRYSAVNNNVQFSGEDFVSFLDANYQFTNTTHIPKKLKSHFSFVDRNKNLWIATFTNGVYFLPYANQKAHYSLRKQKVGEIQKVKNTIIASVYKKGFYKYDTVKKEFKQFLNVNDFNFRATYIKLLNSSFYTSDKQTIGIKNGVKTTYKKEDNFRSLVYYNKFLYGNTSFGISKINPKNHTIIQEYLQNGIRDITLFKTKIFIASANGIKQFYNDSITPVFIGNKTFNKPIVSLSKLNDEQLIVCTNGFGAYRTDLNTIELLEQSDYLNVQQAFVENNTIWLATNQGVWQYKKEDKALKLIKKYTINDGLSSNDINSVFIYDNTILASSNDGVSVIPIVKEENNQFINTYFDTVQYNNKSIINNKLKYSNDNHLQVKIASIDFSETNKKNYSYQLLPIQKKWSSTSSNQIFFADLPPNKYLLKIKSNSKTNSIKFEILPLWYQTNVFKITLIILGLILLYLSNRWNQKRIAKREQKRAAIQQQKIEQELYALRSQMNPHFVFNSLSAIQYYINDNDTETSEVYLIKFSQLIRRFFELSKEKEITLKEEISLLNNYLEIEKLRFKEKLSFKINIDDNLLINDVKIPTMLLQPIVENAVNHGIFNKLENGLITLNFRKRGEESYEVEIIDDGVGIANTKPTQMKTKNSSMVLKDKLHYLNEHQNWRIQYSTEELHPTKKDKGNLSKFTITRL